MVVVLIDKEPPRKPKIEVILNTIFSTDCLIRRMAQLFLFQIDLTLTVAMVTENGHQYRLKIKFGG